MKSTLIWFRKKYCVLGGEEAGSGRDKDRLGREGETGMKGEREKKH